MTIVFSCIFYFLIVFQIAACVIIRFCSFFVTPIAFLHIFFEFLINLFYTISFSLVFFILFLMDITNNKCNNKGEKPF